MNQDDKASRSTSSEDNEHENEVSLDDTNWVDAGEGEVTPSAQASQPKPSYYSPNRASVVMVETAFLASTASLIWLINFYFPPGPLLRILFPVPIALAYLRRGNRASGMAALTAGLLLSVLMGPPRSLLYLIPYGLMGIQLGALWKGGASWLFSISIGTLIGTFGVFFRFWLLSIFLGEDLWSYVIAQVAEFVEWGLLKLGILAVPSLALIQVIALVMIVFNNVIYLFVVHVVSSLILTRLGNPIPPAPNWVQVLWDDDN